MIVLGIGFATLLGWVLGIDALTNIIPGRVTQKPNTAMGLAVSALTLALWHWQWRMPAGRRPRWVKGALFAMSAGVIVLGLETIIEYGFNIDFGLNRLPFEIPATAADGPAGGRPAINTATSFILIQSAILLLLGQRYRASQALSAVVFFIALLGLTGHLYAVSGFYRVGVTGMAIHTAIAFLLLSLGVLCAQADSGWMRTISGGSIGSDTIRRTLPVLLILPIILGGVTLWTYQRLSLEPEAAIALRSIFSAILFSGIVLWTGRSLNRIDAQRLALQQQFNQALEAEVASRTTELHAANTALQHEVSRREQTEAQLREREAELSQQLTEIETIYQSAPIGLNMLDSELHFIRINERLAEMNGFSVEAHIGRTIRELLPDLADAAEQLLLPIFETGEPLLNVEIRGETPAQPGVERIWLESFLPLKEGEHVIGISTVCEEVTERKQTEADLIRRATQQSAVAKIGQQALASSDLDALLEAVVEQVAETLEVEYCKVLERLPDNCGFLLRAGVGWREGLVGSAVVPNDSGSQAGYTLLSQEAVVVEDLKAETRFTGPDLLTQHDAMSGISTIVGGADAPYGVFGIHTRSRRRFTDNDVNFLEAIANILAEAIARQQNEQALRHLNISLEQRVQDRTQKLQEANQELEAFSYSVAHDLRAPLRAIQGFAEVLEEDYSTALDELGLKYIRRMAKSAETLNVLIQDLLAYSRLGRTDVKLEPISLSATVKQVLKPLQPVVRTKQATVDVAPNLPMVHAQRSILKQVLSNLIDNSLKFIAPNTRPQVHIWAEPAASGNTPEQWIRLCVEDNGIGILPQHQERIFGAFERLHGAETYSGTGIGLSIVKRGLERMGGRVGVTSVVGQGSQFWIELKGVTDQL